MNVSKMRRRRQKPACLGACCFVLLASTINANGPLPINRQRPPPPPRLEPRPPPPPRPPERIMQSDQKEDEKRPAIRPHPPEQATGAIRPPPRPQAPPQSDLAQPKRSLMQVHQKAQQMMQVEQQVQTRLHQPPPPQQQQQQQQRPPLQQQQQQQQRPPLQQQQQQQQRQQQPPPLQQQPSQWLPQYQYARPLKPPPQRRTPPQGTLKSLWQRVERGLDGLADLEDAVAGRAKSLFSKEHTVSSFQALPPPASSMEKTLGPEQQRRMYPKESHGESSDDEGASVVDLYKMYAREEKHPAVVPDTKLIGANGGASAPPPSQPVIIRPAVEKSTHDDTTGPFSGPYPRPAAREVIGERRMNAFGGNGQSSPYGREKPQEQRRPPPRRSKNPISEFNAMPTSERPPARPFVDDEPSSPWSKFVSILPPLPHLPSVSKLMGRGSNSFRVYADSTLDAWKKNDDEASGTKQPGWRIFRREKSDAKPLVITTFSKDRTAKSSLSMTPPIAELLARSKHGNSTCLLSDQDVRKSRSIGKSRAAMDVACLGFILFSVRELLPYLVKVPVPHSVSDLLQITLFELRQALALLSSTDKTTWAPFGFAAAFLTWQTNSLLYDSSIRSVASSVGSMVQSATQYGQLYLRLIASLPVDKHVPDRIYRAASSQFVGVAAAARLRFFVLMVLSVVVVMTVSSVRPVVVGILVALTEMVTLEQWRQWPLRWSEIGSSMKDIILPLGGKVRDLVAGEMGKVMDEPLKLAFTCSVFLALLAMTTLPMVEQRRAVPLVVENDEEDEEEAAPFAFGSAESISKLGLSSASRLGLLAESGAPEAIMERWRAMLSDSNHEHRHPPLQSMVRLVGYGALTTLFALFPLLLHLILGISTDLTTQGPIHVHSVVDSSILLMFAVLLTWNTMGHLIVASDARPSAVSFLKSLDSTVAEFARSQQPSQMNLQLTASISPSKGLNVIDLWSAHKAKRAWAVRGAHLSCRNGEVVVILGDDGAGKSRLLTAISEAIVAPPRRSLTTTRVRGSVTFGGVDVSKWDRCQMKKRLGLVLNDVRSVSDTAVLFSGLTLEEILEPLDGVHHPGESHMLSTQEKSAMNTALQITGLSATLLPRLPSKLSTVVTANEDELIPSPLRPRCNVLSPAEWSKLLLARVLTQTILDNENPASSDHGVEKSLIGSLLLLDDVMVHMSEVEEANLIATLRRTGAASVVTSHKWATGRFADRIVVIKDGAIVENGTHNELLAKGPQQSIYAAKWHAMTTL